jgi:hypothetical protein
VTGSGRKYLVFLSYSHKDRWIAKQCARLIEEQGGGQIRTFLDEKDIEGGQPIAETIRRNLERSDEFVVLLSRYSKDRPWVLIEIGAAWGLRKPIIAIMDKLSPKERPEIISPYKSVDLNDFDRYLAELVRRSKGRRK